MIQRIKQIPYKLWLYWSADLLKLALVGWLIVFGTLNLLAILFGG